MKISDKLNTAAFHKNDIIVIGLSGGADSVALTHMLYSACSNLSLQLVACHVNHCLRGEESERDSRFVQNFCAKLHIPLYIKRADIKALSLEQGTSVEECGRNIRYEFFEQTAAELESRMCTSIDPDAYNKQNKIAHIVTAHNLSDNVETLIFNLSRGSALKGLCGIPSVRDNGRIVRPMLNITRAEVEQYCAENCLTYVTDSSNLEDIYARNNIRHKVIPVLKQINPALESKVCETIEVLLSEQDFMDKYATEKYNAAYMHLETENLDGILLSRISCEHDAILNRIIVIFLQNNSCPVSRKNVELVAQIIKAGCGQHNILKGKFISVKKSALKSGLLVCETRLPHKEILRSEGMTRTIRIPENSKFHSETGKTYKVQTLSMITSESFNKIYKKLFAISLDCGKICGSIILRGRLPGDKIKLSSNSSTKSLKNLFQENKVDARIRKQLFVIADDKGVLAVEGIGVSARAQCDDTTKQILFIEEIQNDL